jgi:phasin
MIVIMNSTKTTSSRLAGSPMSAAPQAIRAMAEKGASQAKETYEKASAATAEATDLIKSSCSTALKGAHDYNNKLLEFAQTNADVAFGFARELLGVKSPSELMQLSTEHARQQFGTLTEQAMELAALGQKLAYAITEPLKTGVAKAFSRAA